MSDSAYRDQALDPGNSFIVQAPAGSGKTELLTQRYLKLLSVASAPESVLAMTFTKKAAGELLKRVTDALVDAQGEAPTQAHKHTTYELARAVLTRSEEQGWALLNHPARLKITTIDSLASLVVSRYPSIDKPLPKQILASTWEAEQYYQDAAQQVLKLMDESEYQASIANVLLHLDNDVDKFCRLLVHMLSRRDQWLSKLYQQGAIHLQALQESAQRIVSQHLQTLQQQAAADLPKELFTLLGANTNADYQQLTQVPGAQLEALNQWQHLRQLLLTGSGTWRKSLNKNQGFPPEVKAQKDEFLALLSAHQTELLRRLLIELDTLPALEYSDDHLQVLTQMAEVLKLAVAELNLAFERDQATDFIQLSLDALALLDSRGEQVSDMALFLDHQVEHLLVDEFQDTSLTQFELIRRLVSHWSPNEGKTLFLVGDPMQSIYRFRESKVGLFLQVRDQGIGPIHPTFLHLTQNFRSSREVIEENNALFATLFPTTDDMTLGAIRYSASSVPDAAAAFGETAIQYHGFAAGRYDLEAEALAALIEGDTTSQEIAVIARGRSHLQQIVAQLKARNIGFEALKVSALKDHLFTRDLISLTRALLDPTDKLAWLSVLRAPWCGLRLNDLLHLAQAEQVSLFDRLSDAQCLAGLSDDGATRVTGLQQLLAPVVAQQGRFGFAELLAAAIKRLTRGRLSVQEQEIERAYLTIVTQAQTQDNLDPQSIDTMLSDLYAPSTPARVKVMTIHESKGLEFETVIIPGLDRAPQVDKAPLVRLQEFADGSLLLAPTKSYQEAKHSQTYQYLGALSTTQDAHETLRLLYVAMTRAKRQLHLSSCAPRGEKPHTRSFLSRLQAPFASVFDHLETPERLNTECSAPELMRYTQLAAAEPWLEAQGEHIHHADLLQRLLQSRLGTLVHQYCEQEWFQVSDQHIKDRLLEQGLAADYLPQVRALLDKTRGDTQHFDWLFSPRASTQVEAAFVSHTGTIVVDRLFIDQDTLWVIDFKTADLLPAESLSAYRQRLVHQYQAQLGHYQQVLSDIYELPIRCALYTPATQQLIHITL